MSKKAIIDRELWAITLYIAHDLPSQALKSKIINDFQRQKWDQIQSTLYAVGLSWWAKDSYKDNPLQDWVDQGVISKRDYDYYEQLTSVFRSLWPLIQEAERFIRAEAHQKGISYPFEKEPSRSAALFKEIIRIDADSTFEECLNYIEVSAPKTEAAFRLFAAHTDDRDESKLKTYKRRLKGKIPGTLSTNSLPGWRGKNFWFNFALDVCEAKAKSNVSIRNKLKEWSVALTSWADLLAKSCRDWPSYTYNPRSNIVKTGTAAGGAYS